MRNQRHLFTSAALLALLVGGRISQAAEDKAPSATLTQVQTALTELNQWLGQGANGDRWRSFLQTDQLKAELAKGSQADRGALGQILALYTSPTPGLTQPGFVKVKQTLQAWIDELSVPGAAELPGALREAKGKFHPVGEADLTAARNNTWRAMHELEKYLGTGPNAVSWKSYLKYADLQGQFKAGVAPSVEALKGVLAQLDSGQGGLEADPFLSLQGTLNKYIQLLETAANAKAPEAYDENVVQLATALEAYAKQPTETQHRQVGLLMSKLLGSQQAATLLQAVQRSHSQPNLYGEISSSVLSAGVNRKVDDVAPIRDNILGTSIVGTGRTLGEVVLKLIPDAHRALLETSLVGTTSSDNVGYHGKVTIFTKGTTHITGQKRIVMDATGVRGLPGTATAKTTTQVTGLNANSGMVENMAWKRVGENKSQAEQIGSQHAEQKIIGRMEQQAGPMIAKSNQRFQEKFRGPLLRYGAFPRQLDFRTSDETLYVTGFQAADDQLAAPNAPPELPSKEAMSLRLHESAANNMAAKRYGGRTITNESVKRESVEILGKVPDELGSSDPENEHTWTMTFHDEQPVVLQMAGQGFKVLIRGSGYTRDDRSYPAMDISAEYKLEKTDTGMKAVRQGGLQIIPPGFVPGTGKTLTAQQTAIAGILRKRFDKLLKPEFVSDGLILPGELKKAGKMLLTHMSCDNGWLVLTWKQGPPVEDQPEPKTAE